MAYTSVIPVRRLDRTVDYVQKQSKKNDTEITGRSCGLCGKPG